MAERRAFVCLKCVPPRRVFALAGQKAPHCGTHGKMERQVNKNYRAK